jgi:D-serine deaminase-like pyridoxal phosphate-dependent protein
VKIQDLATPALVVDAAALEHNLATMAEALPGKRLRPHVKAHKSTALARLQTGRGHTAFTCATIREVEGMAAAGLGDDLLLANEVTDATRLGVIHDARVTVAVDSPETVEAAARGGVAEVLVDVNVGLPRCGCDPGDAGRIAEFARARGLGVRGVMGYEGHVVGEESHATRAEQTEAAMARLLVAHGDVGGEVVSAGGTGTYALNTWATEIQAGSYLLMDSAYAALEDLPFREALCVLATVIHVGPRWAVADAGLKALSMDHGDPRVEGGDVWFYSDEHVTFRPAGGVVVGDRVRVRLAHVDPTVAKHERLHVVDGDDVIETYAVDLRGW